MRNKQLAAVKTGVVVGFLGAVLLASPASAQAGRLPRIPGAKPHRVLAKPPALKLRRIDPAAVGLGVRVLKKRTAFDGDILITGTVKNIGTAPFRSRPHQQEIQLWADKRLVARRKFTALAVGASVQVSFRTAWRTTNEFPPCYRVVIAYDPDIYLDGNRQNDDANQRNNQKELKGHRIHEIFRQGVVLKLPGGVRKPRINVRPLNPKGLRRRN